MSQTPADQPPTAAEVLAAQAAASATSAAPAEQGSLGSAEPASSDPSALITKLAEREDQLMRLAAELENMRRRHSTELANASKFAIESFAEAMLPVADSMETALSLPEQTLEGLRGGVELTLRQLQQAFERGRLRALSPTGEKFNPNHHQAVSMVDGATAQPAVPSGHVVAVMQKGYLIGERVLRPALVVVAQ